MPATLELDHVSQASITEEQVNAFTPIQRTVVRRGVIKGLNTLGLASNEIFAATLSVAGMPAYGDPFGSGDFAGVTLRQRIVEGIDGNAKKVRIALIYKSTGGYAPIPVTFILSRRTAMVEVTAEIHPGTGEAMVIEWQHPTDINFRVKRTAGFRYRRPHQVIVADGYYVGEPPAAMVNALGSVNSSTWRGKAVGYWLYSGQSDVTRDFGGSYNITLELETRVTVDWSDYELFGNHQGRNLTVDPSDLSALRGQPYAFDVKKQNGLMRVGLYPLADFNALFGFGGIA
jgi:hypothetical protein